MLFSSSTILPLGVKWGCQEAHESMKIRTWFVMWGHLKLLLRLILFICMQLEFGETKKEQKVFSKKERERSTCTFHVCTQEREGTCCGLDLVHSAPSYCCCSKDHHHPPSGPPLPSACDQPTFHWLRSPCWGLVSHRVAMVGKHNM